MQDPRQDILDRLLGELFRAPEPLREIALERALARLQAARSDASYLLLHRVLAQETALRELRQHASTAAAAGEAVMPGPAPTPAAASRSLLRDAAVVTLGVVAGQAIWGGMSAETDFDADLSDGLDGLLD